MEINKHELEAYLIEKVAEFWTDGPGGNDYDLALFLAAQLSRDFDMKLVQW